MLLEQQQFLEPFQEIVGGGIVLPAAQRVGGDRIGAGRAAEPEIDAAGEEAFEHLEAFRHHERGVVGQHHAAGADTYVRGRRGDLSDHDVGRGTCDGGKVVVLGHPIARKAKPIGEAGEIEAVVQRQRRRAWRW